VTGDVLMPDEFPRPAELDAAAGAVQRLALACGQVPFKLVQGVPGKADVARLQRFSGLHDQSKGGGHDSLRRSRPTASVS
jgi:hypothetical protein